MTHPDSFYERVYAFVARVPEGQVVTYGQVAALLGAPAAARAVGYALRMLPGDTEVPWWRVINREGRISLKGRGPGAELQREILETEGLRFDRTGAVDLAHVRWWPESSDNSAL